MTEPNDNIRATADIQAELRNLTAEYGHARGAIADLENRIDAKHRSGDTDNVATLARKLSQARHHETDVGARLAAIEDELAAAKERDENRAKVERAARVPAIREATDFALEAASAVDDALIALEKAWNQLDRRVREAASLVGKDGQPAVQAIRSERPLQSAMRKIDLAGRPMSQRVDLNVPGLEPMRFYDCVSGRIETFDKIADRFESEGKEA